MSTNAKITSVLLALLIGIAATITVLQLRDDNQEAASTPTGESVEATLVRDDSRYLSQAPDDKVTLVEFLDFECEACLALYPTMEQLRHDYGDRITFVVRYFPMPGHPNSMTAATAVEAAAQMGAFEQMYQRVFETQTEWGHTDSSQSAMFVQYAKELGLDESAFQQLMNAPETLSRVERDVADGKALMVEGTPTIYINGVQTEPMPSYLDLVAMIDRALNDESTNSDSPSVTLITSRRDDALRPLALHT